MFLLKSSFMYKCCCACFCRTVDFLISRLIVVLNLPSLLAIYPCLRIITITEK